MTDAKSVAGDQLRIDWNAVHGAALNCLNATWSMICFANLSQKSEYDTQTAITQLDDIDRARATFRQAMETLEPGFECSSDPSFRDSRVFKALAVAISHQGAHPEFRFGPICCATAHEAAFESLRWAILWVESELNAALDELGAPDHYVVGIDLLHKLSHDQLRNTLVRLEERKSIQKLVDAKGTRQMRSWIDREWAAVCADIEMERQAGSATRAKLDFDPDDSTTADRDTEKCFSVSELTKITGVKNDTLQKYGKPALGRWIGRGQRGKHFTQSDAITIISAVNEGSTEVGVKKNCTAWLESKSELNPKIRTKSDSR